MGLQETVIDSADAWYMQCYVCDERSPIFATPEEALAELKVLGWISKSFFRDRLACDNWYCPKCLLKATEPRDTLVDIKSLCEGEPAHESD